MNRWTERFDSDGEKAIAIHDGSDFPDVCFEGEREYDVMNALAEYEDLEEQGLLLKLPCREAYSASGDMIYLIFEDEIVECVHCGLKICPVSGEGYIPLATDEDIFPYRNPDPEHDLDPTDWCTNATDVGVNEIGKTLFFTREEAEKKLEEMENAERNKE